MTHRIKAGWAISDRKPASFDALHLCALILLSLLCSAQPAGAKVYLTREEGLRLAFGDSLHAVARTAFLEPAQIEAIRALGRAPFEAARVTHYEGVDEDSVAQLYAYTDTHVVRSMTETVLIVLERAGRVRSVEVLAFEEPEDYLAPTRWLGLWKGKTLAESSGNGGALPNLAGATLTAHALTEAVRRVQAVHEILHPRSDATSDSSMAPSIGGRR